MRATNPRIQPENALVFPTLNQYAYAPMTSYDLLLKFCIEINSIKNIKISKAVPRVLR